MKNKSVAPKSAYDALRRFVLDYAQETKRVKRVKDDFAEFQERFYAAAERYFDDVGIDPKAGMVFHYDDASSALGFSGSLSLKKVQNSNVVFDADALARVLSKKLAEQVVVKRYEVTDMPGLVAYLKEIGADPKIFKSFLDVRTSVDVGTLNSLEAAGKISLNDVEGAYTVNKSKPYFRVTATKGKGDCD